MYVQKIKAGALQLTLFICVVIAILLFAFIILVHTQKQFSQQSIFIIQTVKQAGNGIDVANNMVIPLNDTLQLNSDNELSTLKVHRDFWGVFEKVTSQSKTKKKVFTKVALVGAKQNELQPTALYLQDNKKPLVLVGNTFIQGLTYLPELGVKPGTISGQSYYGEQLIYGSTQHSGQLPKLQAELLNELKGISNIDLIQAKAWQNNGNKKVSFVEPLHIMYSANTIRLSNSELSGHIIIKSQSKIVVDASSKLKDIVLIAPEIEIKSSTVGNFQAIASKKITVGTNCRLDYPSALVVIEQKKTETDSISNTKNYSIDIQGHSTVKGVVLFLGEPKEQNFEAQINISENASVEGDLYCNQNLDLKGEVKGTVYTSNFVTKAFGSIYQNHLLNARISKNDLQEEYVGMLFNESQKDIVKWLY